jgi:hypothetical protein
MVKLAPTDERVRFARSSAVIYFWANGFRVISVWVRSYVWMGVLKKLLLFMNMPCRSSRRTIEAAR